MLYSLVDQHRYGRHLIHIHSYRSVPGADPSGAGPSSASLPSTPETRPPPPPSSSSRKQPWSTGSSSRRRAQSAKFPPPPSGVAPRITRSSSGRDKSSALTPPIRVTRSSTGPGGASASASRPRDSDIPKEKAVRLSPLYQALLQSVKFELGKNHVFNQ